VIVEVVQHDAILTIDAAGRIDSWNASGERLFGRSQADVLGRPLIDLMQLGTDAIDDLLQVAVGVGWNETEGWTRGHDDEPFYADTMVSA
ncbi:MAG: PAS domain-containing protein, partial [Ilumatobacteraceae bacterium]